MRLVVNDLLCRMYVLECICFGALYLQFRLLLSVQRRARHAHAVTQIALGGEAWGEHAGAHQHVECRLVLFFVCTLQQLLTGLLFLMLVVACFIASYTC